MSSDGFEITQLADKLQGVLPERAGAVLSPVYHRYLSWKANQTHDPEGRIGDPRADTPDHVLVVVVDALRPDAVPDVPLSFTRAISPSTWTFPAVTSLHTGQYPNEHGAVAHTHPDDEAYAIPKQTTAHDPLPGLFEQYGFDTYAGCAFITPFLALRGWYQTHRVYPDAPVGRVFDDYRTWRADRDRTFAYLHAGDLHAPIEPPRQYVERRGVDTEIPNLSQLIEYTDSYDGSDECVRFREERLKLYRAALDYVSDELEALIEEVRDDTLLVVTGDHGEAHWEHFEVDRQFTDSRPNYGVGHGGTPFDMVARVPVAAHHPTEQYSFAGGWPSLIDVSATVSNALCGRSPYPSTALDWSDPIPEERTVICEGVRYGTERKAAYEGQHKVIRSQSDGVTLSARVLPDHGEEFGSIPDDVEAALLEALPDQWDEFDNIENPSKGIESQLKALGYK